MRIQTLDALCPNSIREEAYFRLIFRLPGSIWAEVPDAVYYAPNIAGVVELVYTQDLKVLQKT